MRRFAALVTVLALWVVPAVTAGARTDTVGATIAQLQTELDGQAASCDHNAVFTLAYLRTTESVRWARDQPGYFTDPAWVTYEDGVFAGEYFAAFNAYQAHSQAVPAAWRIAFEATGARRVTALGDALLGMNAHINRDLPYVLASVGLTTPGGGSRKPDHDKIQQVLAATIQPLLDEIAARFDPTVTQYGPLGTAGALQLIATWRELAWHNAQLLVAAPAGLARDLVATTIEATSATEAQLVVATNSYLPVVQSSGPRDAWCAAHHGVPPPSPYPFGLPPA